MVYNETREKSAELLRNVVAQMSQHDAPYNPVSYTVWYEYAAGLNARLNEALDRMRQTEPRLSADSLQRLYREHIAGIDDKTMERISRDFQAVMAGVSETVRRTGDQAGAFGMELSGLSDALQSQDPTQLESVLQQTLRQSQDMQRSAATLQAEVNASQKEIEKLRADLDRARQEVFVDSLTKVMNRKGLDHQLEKLLKQPALVGTPHGLVMLDIDHFKNVNDTHGHLVGDQVLAAVGELLRLLVNGPGQLVARYGGEEFAVLLPNSTTEQTLAMAETIRAKAKAMKLRKRNAQDVVLSITVSAGAASLNNAESASDWIARADAALYESKRKGRDQVNLAA
jgi:diguanylate cyclase